MGGSSSREAALERFAPFAFAALVVAFLAQNIWASVYAAQQVSAHMAPAGRTAEFWRLFYGTILRADTWLWSPLVWAAIVFAIAAMMVAARSNRAR
ncbi:MAG: hypothetical protein GIW95_06195 [Candidatus Eremiobacteraeota bacterium]|nr:hypothetical protein [Candidatus Eremiobacteraeota bacterium]